MVGPPGATQWGLKAGEVGVDAKGSRGLLKRSDEKFAGLAGTRPTGGLFDDLPFEPRERGEEQFLRTLELACAESER